MMDRDRDKAKSELVDLFDRASRPADGEVSIGIGKVSGDVVIGDQVNVYREHRRAKRPVSAREEARRQVLELVTARAEELGLVDDQVCALAGKFLNREVVRLDLLNSEDLARVYSDLMSMRRPAAE